MRLDWDPLPLCFVSLLRATGSHLGRGSRTSVVNTIKASHQPIPDLRSRRAVNHGPSITANPALNLPLLLFDVSQHHSWPGVSAAWCNFTFTIGNELKHGRTHNYTNDRLMRRSAVQKPQWASLYAQISIISEARGEIWLEHKSSNFLPLNHRPPWGQRAAAAQPRPGTLHPFPQICKAGVGGFTHSYYIFLSE